MISGHRDPIPPSLSNSSLLSASSGASWQSVSSTSSRKHDLELPFEVSPRAKRRLLADTHNTATLFRYSAPCVQSYSDMDSSDRRRGGLLRKSGTPMQSFYSNPTNSTPLPPTFSCLTFERGTAGANGGHAALASLSLHPRPIHLPDITSLPVPSEQHGEQRAVPKRSRHSLAWPFISPPTIGKTTIPELSREQADNPTRRDYLTLGCMGTSTLDPSITLDTAPQRAVSAHLPDFKGAQRLDAFRTLDGTNPRGRLSQGSGDGSHGEEKPITMCGKRLYSDWVGYWGRLM